MARSTIGLSCLLLATTLSLGYGLPLNTPCTTEEIIAPIKAMHELVEKMQDPGMDANPIMEKIEAAVDELPAHVEQVKATCGDEKAEGLKKIENFMAKTKMVDEVMAAMDAGEMEKAKTLIENIDCEHMAEYIIRKYGTDMEKLGKIIDVIKLMDDMKMVNMMVEGMIYIMNDSNIMMAKDLIPMMKEKMMANKDNMTPEMMQTTKLNMKEMVKRSISHCYEGLIMLTEIDHEMADQAMYEAIFQVLSESIYNPVFKIIMGAPNMHKQAIGMQAVYDKMIALEKPNSYIGGKLYYFAEKMMNNEEIKKDEKAMEIMTNIMNNISTFAKNLAAGYSCQNVEQVKAMINSEDITQMEHNEYMVFYNPELPEIFSHKKYMIKPDGDMMMITIEREVGGKMIQYSMMIKNDEYPENLNMKGIISRNIIGAEPTTSEELCAMNPKAMASICIPFAELFNYNMEESVKVRNNMYESFVEHIKICNKA